MSLNKLTDSNLPTPYINPNVGSLKLYNSSIAGYNQSALNVFEEFENLTLQFSELDNTPIVGDFKLRVQRIGNYVNLYIDKQTFNDASGSRSTTIQTIAGALPARFRPVDNTFITVYCFPGAHKTGILEILGSGQIRISSDLTGATTWVASNNFFGAGCATYKVA